MKIERILPTAAVLAVVEGLVLGYVFSGVFSGMGLDPQYWLLMGAIVAIATFAGALVIDLIVRTRRSRADAARVGLIAGSLLGLLAGYFLQPRGGPV